MSAVKPNRPVSRSAPSTSAPGGTPEPAGEPLAGSVPIDAMERAGRGAVRPAPFDPPPVPLLLDETRAMGQDGVALARAMNGERIAAYNAEFAAYLQRYAAGVDAAVDRNQLRAFGPPSSYSPVAKLPVSQRAQYGLASGLHDSALECRRVAFGAIGRALERLDGVRPPLDVDVKVDANARLFAVGGRVGWDGTAAAGERGSFELGVEYDREQLDAIRPEPRPAPTRAVGTRAEQDERKANLGGSLSVNQDGDIEGSFDVGYGEAGGGASFDGDGLKSVRVRAGALKVALDRDGSHELAVDAGIVEVGLKDGKLTTDAGFKEELRLDAIDRDVAATATLGSAYDLKNRQVELSAKAGFEIEGLVELEAGLAANVQLVSPEHAKRMIDGRSVFETPMDEVSAKRAGGR